MNAAPKNGPALPALDRRLLPKNLDLEASVLGGVILRNDMLALVPELETDHFYDLRHKIVWQAIRNLDTTKTPIDVVTLEVEIEKQGKLDAIGGISFLGELALRVPTADNVVTYAREVMLLHRNRAMQIQLSSALARAQTWQHDPSELFSELVGDLQKFDTDHPAAAHTREKKARWVVSMDSFFEGEEFSDDDAEDWIVRDLIPRAEPVIFGGPMKGGKTWAAMDLSITMALGEDWLGIFENTLKRPARVLGLFLEDNRRRIGKRLQELARGHGRDLLTDDTLREHLRIARSPLRLPDAKDQAALAREIKDWGADVVFVDNLTRIMIGDANSTRDAAAFTRAWTELGDATGATIVLLHHTKKPMGDQQNTDPFDNLRGSTDFGAAARNMIVTTPLRLEGETMAEVRMRGNLDLRRDSFALGFERWTDPAWQGKHVAKLLDRGEVAKVKEEAKSQKKQRKETDKKADAAAKYRERRDTVIALAHKQKGSVSQSGAALELGVAANTLRPVFEALVADGVLKKTGKMFALVADDPAVRQGSLL